METSNCVKVLKIRRSFPPFLEGSEEYQEKNLQTPHNKSSFEIIPLTKKMKRRKELDTRFDALDTLFVGTSCPLFSILLLVIRDIGIGSDLGHVKQRAK
jgi:hypothetical protein